MNTSHSEGVYDEGRTLGEGRLPFVRSSLL